jgi:flagellar biosynthesis protein FlhF
MDFVKIRGKDIQDCFMQMKMKYGPEAHVYEQRVVTEGGLFGTNFMAKKYVEIEIGVPEQQTSKERVEKKLQDLKELLRQKSQEEAPKKKSLNDIKPILQREKEKEKPLFMNPSPPVEMESEKEEGDEIDQDYVYEEEDPVTIPTEKQEIGLSIKNEIVRKDSSLTKSSYDSIYLRRLKERFVKEGMTADYAEEIILKADKHLSYIDKAKSSAVNEKVAHLLEERISIDSDLFSRTSRGKRKVIFLIGPTGSGKTTTIAKLAAKYFLHMGRMVSLYTTDNYRIAAIEQLKRYADTMDIPFYAIKDMRKFKENLHRDGSELILIDTAGYNHKNPDFYSKMEMYTEAFTDKDSVENMLVISATSSYSNIKSVMETYEKIGYKRLILTKIDEAEYLSSVLELADTHNKVFSYFSIGQEVPFDILPASKKILSELVVYPEKVKDIRGEAFSVSS